MTVQQELASICTYMQANFDDEVGGWIFVGGVLAILISLIAPWIRDMIGRVIWFFLKNAKCWASDGHGLNILATYKYHFDTNAAVLNGLIDRIKVLEHSKPSKKPAKRSTSKRHAKT